jgi:hypothetical protein
MTRGHRCQIDTAHHFCPNPACAYRGWVDWGNLRAKRLCVACHGYFLETLGTIFHGKRASAELIVHVIACLVLRTAIASPVWRGGSRCFCRRYGFQNPDVMSETEHLAEGLGMRGTARVFEVDPNTVLQWFVETAEQLRAFSQHVLHDVRVRQVQLDELFALLSAVKAGEVSETEAIERLECAPQWVWVAMDSESKLLLAIDVGGRTLAMAQCVVHHVTQVLAPDGAPARAQLNCEVIQSTSDEAPGLLAYVEHYLEAHHSPDLFHVQHELVKAVSGPLATKERAAHKAVTEAREQLERMQTHPPSTGDEPAKRGPAP